MSRNSPYKTNNYVFVIFEFDRYIIGDLNSQGFMLWKFLIIFFLNHNIFRYSIQKFKFRYVFWTQKQNLKFDSDLALSKKFVLYKFWFINDQSWKHDWMSCVKISIKIRSSIYSSLDNFMDKFIQPYKKHIFLVWLVLRRWEILK